MSEILKSDIWIMLCGDDYSIDSLRRSSIVFDCDLALAVRSEV